jgi:DNA invertase Pin-like site-specific DNA recombinase
MRQPHIGGSNERTGEVNEAKRVEALHTGTAGGRRWDKGQRIVGAQRQQVVKDLAAGYAEGTSIRGLASSTGRSYGFVHRALTEAGVALRPRGGARRRRTADPQPRESVSAGTRKA